MPILRPHPLEPLAQSFEGLIGVECFERIANPGKVMAISYWRAAQSVERGRKPEIRRLIQDPSRRSIFADYRLRVAKIIRDDSMKERAEAPVDSDASSVAVQ